MRLSGLSGGLTAGAQRADLLVGVMSDAALARIAQGGTLALGAEASACLLQGGRCAALCHCMAVGSPGRLQPGPCQFAAAPLPSCSDRTAAFYAHDLAVCSLASGCMLDLSLAACHWAVDAGRNARAYGSAVGAAALLSGEVPLPPDACAPLVARLAEADRRAFAHTFDPSTRSEAYFG